MKNPASFKLSRVGRLGTKLGLEQHQFKVIALLIELTHPDSGVKLTGNDHLMMLTYALSTRPYVSKHLNRYKFGPDLPPGFFEQSFTQPYYKQLKLAKTLDLWRKGTPKGQILKRTGLFPYELKILIEDAIRVLDHLVLLFKMVGQEKLQQQYTKLLEDIETGLPKEWRKLLAVDGIGRELSLRLAEKAEELSKNVEDMTEDDLKAIQGFGAKRVRQIIDHLQNRKQVKAPKHLRPKGSMYWLEIKWDKKTGENVRSCEPMVNDFVKANTEKSTQPVALIDIQGNVVACSPVWPGLKS